MGHGAQKVGGRRGRENNSTSLFKCQRKNVGKEVVALCDEGNVGKKKDGIEEEWDTGD